MMKLVTALLVLFAAFGSCWARDSVPFRLPVRAKVIEIAADGKGWAASGEIGVSFEQAQAQLAVKASSSGWVHLHTIALGKDRVLDAWSRGERELTVMAWRIAPGKSGFSYGVSSKANAKDLRKNKKTEIVK